ncbi:hypothetical protein J2W40_003857 [Sphingobium xenophagum]|uniref:Uncharacterized protein n=1 Tax=Sphingobium xenophagum TaxID=121428 RepID=A0ABU1X618_SPHXE|nr:hypothetical protein [Sphingobium xenophagum]
MSQVALPKTTLPVTQPRNIAPQVKTAAILGAVDLFSVFTCCSPNVRMCRSCVLEVMKAAFKAAGHLDRVDRTVCVVTEEVWKSA